MSYRPMLFTLLAVAAVFGMVRLRGNERSVATAEEQAVILKLKLASGAMGSDDERQRIHDLENRLEVSIKRSKVGDFDGDEYGDGYCTIYIYGQSAEALFRAIEPALKGYRAHAGSYALKRYGKPASKEDRLPLGSD